MLTQILSFSGNFIKNFFYLLADLAPYFLLGLLVAAGLKIFLPPERLRQHLGKRGLLAVLKAAALGVPLPLCSCGVLPVAISLYRQGASLPATLAFLVSTPQTGIDAILVTWGLLGPGFALVYALSALGAGIYCGVLAVFLSSRGFSPVSCSCGSCTPENLPRSLKNVLTLAFGELLQELSRPLILGLVLAAFLVTIFPPGFLAQFVPKGPFQYLVMLLSGIPVYMCSTGSLPLAYGFFLQGFSPGSLLIFLLTGPATNVTSLVVIRKVLGSRVWALYLLGLVSFSLLVGYMVDLFSPQWLLKAPPPREEGPSFIKNLSAMVLGVFLIRYGLFGRKG